MLTNHVAALAALAVLGLPPGPCAQEPAAPATPAARFEAVKADHEQAMKTFVEAYRAAKTDAEQEQLLRDLLPKPEPFVARMLAIAADAPKDPVAAECLVWALGNARDAAQAAAILQALQKDHLDSAMLGDACETLRGGGTDDDLAFLRAVLDHSPHPVVRAKACYVLGLQRTSAAEQARAVQSGEDPERVQRLADFYGADWLPAMRKVDAAALQKEGEALLERVVTEFGDVAVPDGTMGERAKNELFELRNLAVGKPAPEIVGKDVDGVEFKLSDYRGKVVFLDFWGFW